MELNEATIVSEVGQLRNWLAGDPRSDVSFEDPFHIRFADVVRGWMSIRRHASAREVCVLLRQVLVRASQIDPQGFVLSPAWQLRDEDLRRCGLTPLPIKGQGGARGISVARWDPEFLRTDWTTHPVDFASCAGLNMARRAGFLVEASPIPADREFTEANGHQTYRTRGQKAVTRSALVLPPGATLIGVLPTGSGKTDVAITVVKEAFQRGRSSVFVVPTTALALDLEVRFREVIEKVWGYDHDVPLVWTSETCKDDRATIVANLSSGQQPVLITSPEAISRSGVAEALKDASQSGLLGWFIVDEAHMIIDWGSDFRMEFAELSVTASQLIDNSRSNGTEPCRVLLLTATLTNNNAVALCKQFDGCAPIHMVAANFFRPEPDIWIADESTREVRDQRLLESLDHLPRPLIIYVTKPERANQLHELLRANGFGRSGVFTGKTAGDDRRHILDEIKRPRDSTLDIVIGTSAFGLGVDIPQLRAVIHACVPETVSRWYQEIGRSGRDGFASLSLTLPANGDIQEALGLGIRRLTPNTAYQHWEAMWASRSYKKNHFHIDLNAAAPGTHRGSYNRRWNAQLIGALEGLGLLTRKQLVWSQVLARGLSVEPIDDVMPEWIELTNHNPILESGFTDGRKVWSQRGLYELTRAGLLAVEAEKEATLAALVRNSGPTCEIVSREFSPKLEKSPVLTANELRGIRLRVPCGRCDNCRRQKRRGISGEAHDVGSFWSAHSTSPLALDIVMTAELKDFAEASETLVTSLGIKHVLWLSDVSMPVLRSAPFVDVSREDLVLSPVVPLLVVLDKWKNLSEVSDRSLIVQGQIPTCFLVNEVLDSEIQVDTTWTTWKRENIG